MFFAILVDRFSEYEISFLSLNIDCLPWAKLGHEDRSRIVLVDDLTADTPRPLAKGYPAPGTTFFSATRARYPLT